MFRPERTIKICGIEFNVNVDTLNLANDQFLELKDFSFLKEFRNLKKLVLCSFNSDFSNVFKKLDLQNLGVAMAERVSQPAWNLR